MQGQLRFHKYEGLGNDFIVVEADEDESSLEDRARALCDRHFGVGADGLLVMLPPRGAGADARVKIINADGTIPEMCGNGVRCVALHVARTRALASCTVRVETEAGVRTCSVEDASHDATVTVDMGLVKTLGERQISIDGHDITAYLADAGNPHAVVFRAIEGADAERIGSALASHPMFPSGTNVEFAHVMSEGLRVVVWERGVGLTLACGTGACAAAAVACAQGFVSYGIPLRVLLPGGALQVTLSESGHASMRGPARRVFSGVIDG